MNLSLGNRIRLLPLVSAVGAVLVVATTLLLGQQVQSRLHAIEVGYTPSVEFSRSMVISLEKVQRSLQDAVAASDLEALTTTDSIAGEVRASLAAVAQNPVLERSEVEELGARFDEYVGLARRTSEAMISGTMSEGMLADIQAMSQQYTSLRETLEENSARDQAAAAEAFASAATLQSRASVSIVVVMLLVVGALIGLGIWLRRDLLEGLSRISESARALARGDVEHSIDYNARHELGDLATVFRSLVEYQRSAAEAARALSAGNLAIEIQARSEEDVLTHELNRARESLRALVGQVAELTEAGVRGDLSHRGQGERFDGAYRDLVLGVNATLDAVIAPINEAAAVLERLAEQDLTARVRGDYKGDHARIKEVLNRAVETLDDLLSRVAGTADEVAGASGVIREGSDRLAGGANEQASGLEEISSSLQELSSMARQNTGNAREAQTLAESARVSAGHGVERMQALSAAMAEIKAASDATARIVKTIDEIAFQTNLLALNAAVEAARAGDAGKGFAVVAEEVRRLAMRSAEAARQTSDLIEQNVHSAESGVSLNGQVLGQLSEISTQVNRVSEVMLEIVAASEQQSDGVTQINGAVEQINGVTQTVAANSEQSAAAAAELSSQADRLRVMVNGFALTHGAIHEADADLDEGESADAPVPAFAGFDGGEAFAR